jgi:hypothetical protein
VSPGCLLALRWADGYVQVHLGPDHRHGVPHRRPDPASAVLLHRQGLRGPPLGACALLPPDYMWSDKSSLQSSILTGVVLLVFGIVKARVSGAAQTTYDYIFSAVTTMFVGGAAAGVAYGVVAALEGAGN